MDLILTSFGLSHVPRKNDGGSNIFYRMPPVSMALGATSAFKPDYAVLLLCDRIIIDTQSFDRLKDKKQNVYAEMAEAVEALHSEGFIRVEDYDAVIASHKEILEEMLEKDLKQLEIWLKPLRLSTQTWMEFAQSFWQHRKEHLALGIGQSGAASTESDLAAAVMQHTAFYVHDANCALTVNVGWLGLAEQALFSSTKRRLSEYREPLRRVLSEYLACVNANLILSHHFGCGFHDWRDFEPFYREKFLGIGRRTAPGQTEMDCVHSLFEVSFPELTFLTPQELLRVLKDKRISDLRDLVHSAAKGEVIFDQVVCKSNASRSGADRTRIAPLQKYPLIRNNAPGFCSLGRQCPAKGSRGSNRHPCRTAKPKTLPVVLLDQ